jgi:hypothetical protein
MAPAARLFDEDFTRSIDCSGADATWSLWPTSAGPCGDGLATACAAGLVVVPTGTDPGTGLPAFAADGRQDGSSGHLRWAAFANRRTESGLPGFSLPRPGILTARMTLSAELYNTSRHPYGAEVPDPDASPPCGMAAMICLDTESGLVFDFALTNSYVWVLYERLPRPGASHGTFSYAIPVAERNRKDTHRFAIDIDAAAGRTRWLLEGTEVYVIDQIGRRLTCDDYLAWHSDGPDEVLVPRQVSLGFGLFADAAWGQGARLTARSAGVAASP